ncbi:heme acquisition protein HasA [Gibbsiella quercinecans]|uniref:Hemophore HasA n=2 Tax=Gibbsiella TaxID=929812 RepID=A0A250B626_9GAMM|nr:heme acquisition protein HasA [Gibbsiella quercinecans]ATA21619.1 hemophore HasA [Gibbsiella quercinecans]RLM06078.1 hemophore HasA [Gibbsiella quercinecans]RLM06234.1 hemophore HasA [Gibbsiella quercinecans]RLM15249.1 hemophore HasA [Gibbsiella quercinecans]TCT88865.1 heme acquisition protein HasA [Gibbsiella quercinecans]
MSFSITYSADYSDLDISSYLTDEWLATFGDANHTNGNVTPSNSGGFYGGADQFSGTQYALVSPDNQISAFLAEGQLSYNFTNHVLSGSLDSLTFGDGLAGGSTSEFVVQEPQVTFNGLNLSSTGSDGVVHQSIYGLMTGTVDPLIDALEGIFSGLNASSAFDVAFQDLDLDGDLTITEAEITAYGSAATAATVGVAEVTDELLAA